MDRPSPALVRELVEAERESRNPSISLGHFNKIKGDYLWIETGRFIEILKSLGVKVGGKNVGKIRGSLGFESRRTDTTRYTLIPVEHFPAEFLNRVGR